MDIRKFAKIITVIGLLAVLVGALINYDSKKTYTRKEGEYTELLNKVDPDARLSADQAFIIVGSPSGYARAMASAKAMQDKAMMAIWVGLAISVLGSALFVSAKKPQAIAV